MDNYKKTNIWKTSFSTEFTDEEADQVNLLTDAYDKMRSKVAVLVNEIATDLPSYTVHDISHLDALWEVASQITGNGYTINPLEGFVLGGAFLLHDAAMTTAAYPGGMEEIMATKEWKIIIQRMMSELNEEEEFDEKLAVEIFLREQHASRAEELPFISWKNPSNDSIWTLIEDIDLQQKLGQFIGQLAASHWWNHDKLEFEFKDKIIPSPASFNSEWSIDLLKLACILRAADAAQIDDRRAPGFLWALRQNIMGSLSKKHWTFQNRLTQAQCRDDALYYASTKPFDRSQASEWWILFDTLEMINQELHGIDDLLSRNRSEKGRFKARRVANIETPSALSKLVPTKNWEPVNTVLSISDIPKLIKKLGGEQLYGNDPFVAVRELIQNAMDATRMRKLVECGYSEETVKISLLFDEKPKLIVEDTGIGMSPDELVGNLLSFGNSGWLADSAIGEYTDHFPSKNRISGQYGIGFFSIFMLGSAVKVKSRRFDRSSDETVILEFQDGLNERPIMYRAEQQDRQTVGGTKIEVIFDVERLQDQFWHSPRSDSSKFWENDKDIAKAFYSEIAKTFPNSEILLTFNSPHKMNVLDGSNWATEESSYFLNRILSEDAKKLI